METISDKSKRKISELKNYNTLKLLLNYSFKKNIDTKNLTIEEYLIEIHKIIFNSAGINSEDEYVNKLESVICCLIENSEKISDNIKLFKYLSSFIQLLFDLLIKTLKDKKNTNITQFSTKVLALLNSKEILTNSELEEKEIKELINYDRFNKAYNALKVKIINKFACYILLFFPELVKIKDEKLIGCISKFLKEKQINKFFKIYEGNEAEVEDGKSNEKSNDKNENNDKYIKNYY